MVRKERGEETIKCIISEVCLVYRKVEAYCGCIVRRRVCLLSCKFHSVAIFYQPSKRQTLSNFFVTITRSQMANVLDRVGTLT